MPQSVHIETSIASYLTARTSRDLRVAALQEITMRWWEDERPRYDLFTSELVTVEAAAGDRSAASGRLDVLREIPELPVDDETRTLATKLIEGGGVPASAPADALHIAIATVHGVDYLLTWNFRHIDNVATKPTIRAICAAEGYRCPEICTPLELLSEEGTHVWR